MLPSPTTKEESAELSGAALETAVEPSPTIRPTRTPDQLVEPTATFGLPPTLTTTATPVCERPENWVVYTVKPGEVLFNLALETGSTVEEVKQINCLTSNILSIGQKLWLPFLPPSPTPTVTNTPLPTPRPRRTSVPTKTPPPPPTATP